MSLASFCPRCGAAVERTGLSSGLCTGCGLEVYANSRPTAGVLLVRGDQVLLVRRGARPHLGKWDIPGGFLEEGEPPEDGARRELREELGLDLEATELRLALGSINPADDFAVLDLVFEARMPDQEPCPGSDAAAFGWFPIDELPSDLAFEATRTTLERWRATRLASDYRLQPGVRVDPAAATLVTDLDLSRGEDPPGSLPPGWLVESGEWKRESSHLHGLANDGESAVLWYEGAIDGDPMIVFEACSLPPQPPSIGCLWETDCDDERGDSTTAGWLQAEPAGLITLSKGRDGTHGIATGGFASVPERTYEIAAGCREGTDFLLVDGVLALRSERARGTWSSPFRVALATRGRLRISRARVFRLV